MTLEIPDSEAVRGFGLVVCRVMQQVQDGDDEGRLPDYVGAVGKITLTPRETLGHVSGPSALIVRRPMTLTLDASGEMVGADGGRGVWLPVGVWQVSFQISGASPKALLITVTEDHTEAAPLDVAAWTDEPIVPGVTSVWPAGTRP